MIRDTTAQRIASEWHSGGGSALYALASTGAIRCDENADRWDNETTNEIGECIRNTDLGRGPLKDLLEYVMHHGPRPAIPDWHERVIRRN